MVDQYNGILKILNEERGINEKVKQLTWNLTRVILEEYDGSGAFSGSFTAFDNDTYALKITFVDYPKLSLAPKSGDEIYYGTSYPEDKIITIKGYTIRRKILKDKLVEALQHEIHHIFELVMAEKDGFFNNQADLRKMVFSITRLTRGFMLSQRTKREARKSRVLGDILVMRSTCGINLRPGLLKTEHTLL